MPSARSGSAVPGQVLTIIMGGGRGSRLFPLTRDRAKPAVPLAGKYRLVDIPISNSINSGMRRIYVLTQFLSASLHRHVYSSFKFDQFSGGFVDMLAAEQTHTDHSWYQGTADAVRKNLVHIRDVDFDYALILSGDQLYRMDYRKLLEEHIASKADLTVSTIPVTRGAASDLGIMQIDTKGRIVRFEEKPEDPELLDSLRLDQATCRSLGIEGDQNLLASMGIYLFNREVLFDLLDNDLTDFSKHVIPQAIHSHRVFAYVFQGYWKDIGTIAAFFEANLDLTSDLPRFNFFDMEAPIYTRPRFLPASKINGASIEHAIIAEGCILNQCEIASSIIGLRCRVDVSSQITRSVIMGADYFESLESVQRMAAEHHPPIGIGKHTRIEHAIIDKNVRIGDDCTITPDGKPDLVNHPLYYIRDGVVIIPKDTVIPHGTVI